MGLPQRRRVNVRSTSNRIRPPASGWYPARNASSMRYVNRAMTDAPLTVYTTSRCGFCHRLKTVLTSNGISYDEIDIEQDPAAAEFVGSVNGGNRTVGG